MKKIRGEEVQVLISAMQAANADLRKKIQRTVRKVRKQLRAKP